MGRHPRLEELVEVADNPEPRCACVLLLDTSGSMQGERLAALTGGLHTLGTFRMTGGTTSVDEMLATTKRGVLVTRLWNVEVLDPISLLSTGYTRDGVWLIEHGKISKPVTNFRFTESPIFVLNQVEQLGVPRRVFHPGAPVVVPSMKVRDFSFTSLSDAV